ncbi:hypothetical protein H4582DRAFT_2084549 [Lactarius indigo]|nr:hypothetical protein H4582DRAFT_2084549 [Lactarius indigo]
MIAMVPTLTCGLITFDETETYTVTLLEVSSPSIRGTVDSTYYTHYSTLSTVEANWSLGNLLDVYPFISNATSYTNLDVSIADIPLTKTTSTIPGPLNVQHISATTVTAKAPAPVSPHWLRKARPGSRHGAAGAREGMVGATVLEALLVDVATLLLARGADYTRRANGVGSVILLV